MHEVTSYDHPFPRPSFVAAFNNPYTSGAGGDAGPGAGTRMAKKSESEEKSKGTAKSETENKSSTSDEEADDYNALLDDLLTKEFDRDIEDPAEAFNTIMKN